MASSFLDKFAILKRQDLLERQKVWNGLFMHEKQYENLDGQFQIDIHGAQIIKNLKQAIDMKIYNPAVESFAMRGLRDDKYSKAVSEEITLLLTTMKLVCNEREVERGWIVDTSIDPIEYQFPPGQIIEYKGSTLPLAIIDNFTDDKEIK